MTALVNDATRSLFNSGEVNSLTATFGVIVVVLTVVLFLERELMRVHTDNANSPRSMRMQFVVVPLAFLTAGIIGGRLLSLAF